MEKDFIAKMSAYNFKEPIHVTVSFDDSDEDSQSAFIKNEVKSHSDENTNNRNEVTDKKEYINESEIKQEVTEDTVNTGKQMNDNNKNTTEDVQELFSIIDSYCSENSAESHKPDCNNPKKRKLDDSPEVQIQQKEVMQNSYHNTDMTVPHMNNVAHQNGQGTGTAPSIHDNPYYIENKSNKYQKTNEESKTDSYVIHLLKTVSKRLIFIVEAYYCYLGTANDKKVAKGLLTKSMNHFLRIKDHFFNLSYCTVRTIILPQEKNSEFITKYLNDTVQLANNKVTYPLLRSFLMEMLEWTKLKQESLSNLPIEPLHSGIRDNKNTNSSLGAYSLYARSTYGMINSQQDGNNTLLKQFLNQPVQPLHPNNKNKTSSLSANASGICSIPFAPPISNNMTNGNVTQEQNNNSCIFTSGPPGRQLSINVDPVHLYQENRQAFSNLKSQRTTQNQSRDFNIHPHHNVQPPPWIAKNVHPMNYQQQPQFNQRRMPLSQPIRTNYENSYYPQSVHNMPGLYGTPKNGQNTTPPLAPAAQPLPPMSTMHSQHPVESAAQPLQQVASAAQPLSFISASQRLPQAVSAAQPLQLASATHPQQPTPPSYQMACNFIHQTQLTMSQHSMDNQPVQSLQTELTDQQNQPETNRSESTDSGFTSPLHFNSSVEQTTDTWEQEQRSFQPTPLITHVTSLNPNASYMEDSSCSMCSKTTRLKCIGCMKISYCSYECQQADWSLHKYNCNKK